MRAGLSDTILKGTHPARFGLICFSGFWGEDLNVKVYDVRQKLTWHLDRWAQNRPIRNKNCLWWPCLLMDRDEMSNLYRGLSIDAYYQQCMNFKQKYQLDMWSSWPNNWLDHTKSYWTTKFPWIKNAMQVYTIYWAETIFPSKTYS